MGEGQKILASKEVDDFIIMINLVEQQASLVIAIIPNLLVRHIVDVEIVGSMLSVLNTVRLGTDDRRHDLFFLGVNAKEMTRIIDLFVSQHHLEYTHKERRGEHSIEFSAKQNAAR
jgi:hypothetical protein